MKTKMILIDGKQVGIAGLDQVFEELYNAGSRPDESVKDVLLTKLKAHNYVPSAKEGAYASAFLGEYRKYCDQGRTEAEAKKKDLDTWQGIPREEIPWYPTIREELCDGCKVCLEFCSFGVFDYDEETNRVSIAYPFNCIVGCSMCAPKCRPKAIAFPPLAMLEAFRKR